MSLVLTLAPGVPLVDLLREVVAEAVEDLPIAPDVDDLMHQGIPIRWQIEHGGRTLCRIVLDLEEISGDAADRATFADGFLSRLVGETERVETCVRFYDVRLLEVNRRLAEEIFELEMRIREALTLLICSAGASGSVTSLLAECVAAPKDVPDADGLRRPHAENELFYLLFSDYTNINGVRKRDLTSVIAAAAAHEDFEEFRRYITRTDVVDDDALQTFVSQLKTLMDPIEKVRNAVAHNRTVRQRLLGNYETARNELEVVLNKTLSNYE